MVVLLGAALSAAGYLLQTFFANPIAGPFVMGISSGAKLAVALVMVVFLNQGLLTSSLTLILAAFAGAMAAMAFVLAVSRRVQRMSILVICGVMIGYICSAITEFVVAFAQDSNIVNLHNWSQGSFSGMTWGNVRAAALVVLPALAAAFCLSKPMSAYQMGEAYAQSVGVNVKRFSRTLVLLSSLLAACITAFAGPISFVASRCRTSQTAAGQRPAAVRPAGLLPGRGGVLPAVRPHRPQPVRPHRAFHQRCDGGVRRTGGHLAAHPPESGGCTMNEFSCEAQDLASATAKHRWPSISRWASDQADPDPHRAERRGQIHPAQNTGGPAGPMGGAVLLDGQDLTAYTGSARAQRLASCSPTPAAPS